MRASSAERRRRPRGTGKELPALIACLVWAGGFEVAPALHLIDHAHQHASVHCHGDVCHDGGDDAPPDPKHGENTLAHRGIAAHVAPPALPPLDPICLGTVVWDRGEPAQATSSSIERARARAPPLT